MRVRLDGWTWALLFSRWIAGLLFSMAGFYKVLDMGAVEHARVLFVEGYAETWIPAWLLWSLGVTIPYIELIAGGLLCLGYRVRGACISLGLVLVIVTFGHLVAEPFYAIGESIFPRLALLIFVLVGPSERDEASLDYWLERRQRR
ncbi:MAG: hypothetical protein OEY14_07620 [Myxococcales bacterium]|nr:hypothetical protein [Myxococcales bacterium]